MAQSPFSEVRGEDDIPMEKFELDELPLRALDLIVTSRELLDAFPISRGALRNARYKDRFRWRNSGNTVLIDLRSFVDWYKKK